MSADSGKRLSTQRGRWSPAAGCSAAVALGLLGAAVLMVVLALALRGELTLAGGTPREMRIWLVAEGDNQGIGVSSARRLSASADGSTECDLRQVRFFLWRSETPAGSTAYCECYVRGPAGWETTGACPPRE